MTPAVDPPPAEAASGQSRAGRWWRAVDDAAGWLSDRLNPILVKETRQALKSKQFMITFALLLSCCWGWSIIGVALMGEDAWRGTQGDDLFFGYYLILSFPLLVIVPFGAFRSLAIEQEDRTYELMSITTLGPRQIIRGKLGSAVLQMIVYLSGVAPCLAFSYLLRGIDFPTILFVICYTVLVSLGLAVIGLLLGTLTSEKHWQVVLSALLLGGLFGTLSGCIAFTVEEALGRYQMPFGDWEFWAGFAGVVSVYAAYFVLIFYAAAAQITFPCDNRSTRLRVTMLAQQVLFIGWMAWAWIMPRAAGRDPSLILFSLSALGLHWYVMGSLMVGESSELSTRARRQLPQSFLGRVFLTWFTPGPGTGYVFAVTSLLAAVLLGLGALWIGNTYGLAPTQRWSVRYSTIVFPYTVVGFSYVVIYLGIGLLLVRLLRKLTHVGIALSLLLQVMLLLLGCGLPAIVQLTSGDENYSLMQVPDAIWTMAYLSGELQPLPAQSYTPETRTLLATLPPMAVLVFLLNLLVAAGEVRRLRVAKPKRVAEEDAQLLAAKRPPPPPVKKSPWD